MNRTLVVLAIALAGFSTACKSKIGDDCSVSTDCSPNGGRVCDTASPGGYCTIAPCDPNGCPESALCVEWRYEQTRTSETWCMQHCGNTGDCDRGGYRCLHPDDPLLIAGDGESLARVTDFDERNDDGFCVYVGD
jgi:hypothetical protein